MDVTVIFRQGDKKVVIAHWKGVCFHHFPVPGAVLAVWRHSSTSNSAAQRKLRAVTFPQPPQSLRDQGHLLVLVVGLSLF